jgi:excisionase family DNA binding protein
MSYSRREKNGAEQSQFIPSAPEAGEPKMIPFAQRLTCTISEACVATGLGRTKLYELIGAGQLATVAVGRRRLVLVRSLQCFLDPNTPNASSVWSRRRSDSHETGNPT